MSDSDSEASESEGTNKTSSTSYHTLPLQDEEVYDVAAMDSKLLTLEGETGPLSRTRNITYTLDTAATATLVSTKLAEY